MKKLLYILLVLLVACSDRNEKQEKAVVQKNTEWINFKSKDSIPGLILLTLREINKDGFKIANRDEKFETTDVILNDSLPRRQLRLLSKKEDHWRLTYIQGGFGKHYVYVSTKIENDSIVDFRYTQTLLELENNDSIDKFLTEGKLKPKKIQVITQ